MNTARGESRSYASKKKSFYTHKHFEALFSCGVKFKCGGVTWLGWEAVYCRNTMSSYCVWHVFLRKKFRKCHTLTVRWNKYDVLVFL